jgi:putative ABC transport system permease protein
MVRRPRRGQHAAQRLGSSAVIVIGIAGVVAVLVAMLAMAMVTAKRCARRVQRDTAIVMRGASAAEVMSVLDRDSVTLVIAQAPGIARTRRVADRLAGTGGCREPADEGWRPGRRGQRAVARRRRQAWAVRPTRKSSRGANSSRHARADCRQGRSEAVCRSEPGHEIKLGNQTWTVVGVFASAMRWIPSCGRCGRGRPTPIAAAAAARR